MNGTRLVYGVLALAMALGACNGGDDEADAPGPSATPSGSASSTPSPSPSATSPSPSPTPTPTPSPPKPSPPQPGVPGALMTAQGAYVELSEDENLTQPDPENGCEVHDPDLQQVQCGVISMAGGIATWVSGKEMQPLPGAYEPRHVVRVYQRLKTGSDSLRYVGYGAAGTWAEVEVKPATLTGQVRDTLVVLVGFQGSGTLRGYDLITWRKGDEFMRLRAHHGEEGKARVVIKNGELHFYGADHSDGAPNCCPNYFTHDVARWDAGALQFRRQKLPKVPTAQVPSGS